MDINLLESFARFLNDYSAHATATVFAVLYLAERRERQAAQAAHVAVLEVTNQKVQASAAVIASAVESLERTLRASTEKREQNDE